MKANYNKTYFRIHSWLIYWYGSAKCCENKDCGYRNPKRFEWALIKGRKHEKKRSSYIQLCPSCHRKYDFTEEARCNLSKAKKGKPALNKRPVMLNNEIVFESITMASKKTNVSITSIHNNIKGLSKSTKIGIWDYQRTNLG